MKKFGFSLVMLLCGMLVRGQEELSVEVAAALGNKFYDEFTGHAVAKQTNERALVITIGTRNNNIHDKAFVVTAEEAAKFDNFEIDACKVYIAASQRTVVLVDEKGGTLYCIGLDTEESRKVLESLKASEKLAGTVPVTFLGYGISYLTGGFDLRRMRESKDLDPFNYLGSGDLGGKMGRDPGTEVNGGQNNCALSNCTSGGAGADDCSISEGALIPQDCSVKCKSGYFACCNSKVVRCYCCKQ
jgi:hypothetical protein